MASKYNFSRFKSQMALGKFTQEFSFRLFAIISWVPAAIFFNNHVAEIAVIGGQSMYPYLNSSFHEGLKKDICWVNKRNPTEGLKRGMIVTLW
jgi:inner membrane protease subunit 2